MLVNKAYLIGMREGEELKAPQHASAAALYDDHVTVRDIIPNTGNSSL
jgi:hypothetical protein